MNDQSRTELELAATQFVELPDTAPQPGTQPDAIPVAIGATTSDSWQLPSEFAQAPFAAGETIKHYQLIRELGRGGMGIVYLARDLRLARRVAIKFLTKVHEKSNERFIAEARVTARCRHDNIVVIYDIDEYQGVPFMVLEYLQGQSFRDLFHKKQMPAQRAVELIIPVVRALDCAHRTGIVHCDLKPANIFLTDTGSVKVLDFGIARLTSPTVQGDADPGDDEPPTASLANRESSSGKLFGTIPYMSPEQVREEPFDQQSDLWALGIILYQMLVGGHPLPYANAFELLETLIEPDLQVPSIRKHVDIDIPGGLADVIDRCLRKDRAERVASAAELLRELEAYGQRGIEIADRDANPFPGLAAFQEEDGARFFGRSRDIAKLCAQLRNFPFIALVGPSGAGKSSLVRAGAIPALKRSGDRWDSYVLRPGREPLAALIGMLESWRPPTSEPIPLTVSQSLDDRRFMQLGDRLRNEPGYLGAALRTRAAIDQRNILVLVDQLEELYTLGVKRSERKAFFACLAGIADDPASPLRVVVTIRSDYVDRLTEDRDLGSQTQLMVVRRMRRHDLRAALIKPLEAVGCRFEAPELVKRMLDALAGTSEPLPILQFAAAQLWERRDRERNMLTWDSYEAIGGVAGALATHADEVLDGMSRRDQQVAREIFERLVTPERTRNVTTLDELCFSTRAPDVLESVVQHLVQMRLLTIDNQVEGTSVDIAHEALISKWPTLARWLDENAEDSAFLAQLRAAAAQWDKNDRDEGLLWRGQPAKRAREWHARHTDRQGAGKGRNNLLSAREQQYLSAVLHLAEAAERRRRYIAVGLITSLVVVAVALSYLTMRARAEARNTRRATAIAEQHSKDAEHHAALAEAEATRARNANRLAAAELSKDDPTAVVAILRELEPGPAPDGWSSLALWALSSGVAQSVFDHPQGVQAVAMGPAGDRIATGSWDNAVRVWHLAETGVHGRRGEAEPAVFNGHTGPITSLAFSRDGRWLVSASEDHTARVWNLDGPGGTRTILRGHTDSVLSVAFSPDNERVITASRDKTVRVWPSDGTSPPTVIHGHTDRVTSACFSPDGTTLASSSEDATIRIWSAGDGASLHILTGHEAAVRWVAFSPDGSQLVSGSDDATVRVWSVADGQLLHTLSGHRAAVVAVEFHPDGAHVVSASYDQSVKIWRADGSGAPRSLRGHGGAVMSVRLSPDGTRIVSGSEDRTARLWRLDDARPHTVLSGHEASVMQASFSPDGALVASASDDHTVRIWRADSTGRPLVLRGHQATVMSVQFSPDGEHVASASWDKTVRIWPIEHLTGRPPARQKNRQTDSPHAPVVIHGHEGEVMSVAYSPDGTSVVTASADKTVRVWPVTGGPPTRILTGHTEPVYSASFSPDGTRIVSSSLDYTVRIWSVDGTRQPLILRDRAGWVWWASFSPDGERIITASDDGVRIWRADGTGSPEFFQGHDGPVYSVSFSPDGRRILSTSADKTVRIWSADGSGEPLILRGHTGNVNRAAFSRDGALIASPAHDRTVRVWRLPEPIERDDERLWQATDMCLLPARRESALGVSKDMAEANWRRCRMRVAGRR